MTIIELLILFSTVSLTTISVIFIVKFLRKIVNGDEIYYLFDYLFGILLLLIIGGFSIHYIIKLLTNIGLI